MADNLELPATGATVGTDLVTIGGAAQHVQRMKLVDGTDGGTDPIPGTAARGLSVDPRLKVVRRQITPAITSGSAYSAKHAVGGLLEFTDAARSAGGTIRLDALQVIDRSQQMAALDLVLFDRSITAPTDRTTFAPTNTELAYCVGVVPIGGYADFSANSVADVPVGRSIVLNGTSLFGVLVARAAPTYTSTSALVVAATITQD